MVREVEVRATGDFARHDLVKENRACADITGWECHACHGFAITE